MVYILLLMSFVFSKTLDIQGHRGARSIHPENTLKAMDYALEVGVTTLELDLVVTKDDILVLGHDPILNKTLCRGPKGKIKDDVIVRSLTYAELQKYNCASVKNPNFPKQKPDKKQKIASLKEVLELVQSSKHPAAKNVNFNIETKMVPSQTELSPSPEVFAKLIIDLVKEYKLESRVILQSFDHRSLQAAKKIEPKIRTAALTGHTYPVDIVALLKQIPAEIWSPNLNWLTHTAVKKVQQAGYKVIPWTANTEREWQALIDMGVDGIITDDPKALMDYIREKSGK